MKHIKLVLVFALLVLVAVNADPRREKRSPAPVVPLAAAAAAMMVRIATALAPPLITAGVTAGAVAATHAATRKKDKRSLNDEAILNNDAILDYLDLAEVLDKDFCLSKTICDIMAGFSHDNLQPFREGLERIYSQDSVMVKMTGKHAGARKLLNAGLVGKLSPDETLCEAFYAQCSPESEAQVIRALQDAMNNKN